MKNKMPLDGLGLNHDSGSVLCNMLKSHVLGQPGGDTMLVLTFDILDLLLALASLHTNIIYIVYIYYKRGNPTKPTETTFSQLFRNETNPSPK